MATQERGQQSCYLLEAAATPGKRATPVREESAQGGGKWRFCAGSCKRSEVLLVAARVCSALWSAD